MTRVTSSDHILGLLRQQLERRKKTVKVASRKLAKARATEKAATQRALARLKTEPDLDVDQQAKTLIAALLADRFGVGLVNDPQFQSLLSEVQAAMLDHPETAPLVEQAISAAKGENTP